MRPWTIPILGAVALSLALPSSADARRFGPGAVLGAVVGAMFGGFRHSSGTIGGAQRVHRFASAAPALRASNGALRLARVDLRQARLPSGQRRILA